MRSWLCQTAGAEQGPKAYKLRTSGTASRARPGAHSGLTTRRNPMKAAVGDRLIVRASHIEEPDRDAEILEVRANDGAPPFLVRWSDNGNEGLYFPGTD